MPALISSHQILSLFDPDLSQKYISGSIFPSPIFIPGMFLIDCFHGVCLDSTPPDISFSSTLPDKTKGTPQITWTSSEPVGLFECALDVQGRKIRCGRGTSGEWNGLNIPHGPHTFWVRGTDSRGNVGEWEPYVFEVGKLTRDTI